MGGRKDELRKVKLDSWWGGNAQILFRIVSYNANIHDSSGLMIRSEMVGWMDVKCCMHIFGDFSAYGRRRNMI